MCEYFDCYLNVLKLSEYNSSKKCIVSQLKHIVQYYYNMGHFTFCISLLLALSLSPKFGLRPNISQKVKSFFSFELSESLSGSLRPNFGLSDR